MDLNHQHQHYNAMFYELKFKYLLLYIVFLLFEWRNIGSILPRKWINPDNFQ